MTLHVVVIGAGIVGVSAAIELIRDGHRVTLLDPGEPGGEQAASYGNGSWVNPASVVPISMPGLWRQVPGYLRDPAGPFTIRPAALPQILPWLLRFVIAGSTPARVAATARALRPLLADGPEHHARLASEAACSHLIRQEGLLYVYPDRGAFLAEAPGWRLRADNGAAWREIEEAELRRREPGLDARYRFGILIEGGAHCLDTGGYVAALARHAELSGATRLQRQATGFDIAGGRLRAVLTDGGPIACDRAVVAAGIGSHDLAHAAGDRVSLIAERGYHVVLRDPEAGPHTPLMPSDGKMANTVTLGGLRAAGQVELARRGDPPDWRRADILLAHLLRTYPALPREIAPDRIARWMGNRPSTPDGLPIIGPASGCRDVVHAFGHGHVGFAAGPTTGRAVADILAERSSSLPLAAYAPSRFRHFRRTKLPTPLPPGRERAAG